jgi:hypothetical protein
LIYIKWHREVSLEKIAGSFHTPWNEVKLPDIGRQRALVLSLYSGLSPVDGCVVGWPSGGPMASPGQKWLEAFTLNGMSSNSQI